MPGESFKSLNISTWTLIRFFGVILGLVFLYYIRDIIMILLFSVIIASAIEPIIEWFRRYRIPRLLSVVLIFLAAALLVISAIYLVVPLLTDELQGFSTSYPVLERKLIREAQKFTFLPFSEFFLNTLKDFIATPLDYLSRAGGGLVNFTSSLFGGIFSLVLLVVLSFYLATQEKGIENFLRLVTPLSHEPYIIDLWARSQKKLGRWFRAQLLLGAIVGVLIFLGLTILGVRYSLVLALIAGAFEIIPVVGPILAAVPATAVAFLQSPFLALLVIALYVVVQQTESHIIIPIVMKRVVGLSSLVVVLALLVGGKLAGILGILLAVPVTAVLAEFLNDIDRKKRAILSE